MKKASRTKGTVGHEMTNKTSDEPRGATQADKVLSVVIPCYNSIDYMDRCIQGYAHMLCNMCDISRDKGMSDCLPIATAKGKAVRPCPLGHAIRQSAFDGSACLYLDETPQRGGTKGRAWQESATAG